MHGGPGYNCINFETTTAQKLADQGFYVIVYDRRGEGRSADPKAAYTFQQSFDDVNMLLKTYKLKKATLIGHSFGGMVATLYAVAYPKKVHAIVLVGAPVHLQQSFRTIINASRKIYQDNGDSSSLGYLDLLEKMDTTSMPYASYCFMNAMKNGFYSPKDRTDEARKIYQEFTVSELYPLAKEMTYQAPQGFHDHEKYTTLNLTATIQQLVANKVQVYGLYGKEDGLYSSQQVEDLKNMIGEDHLKYFDRCSHNVFIDQQTSFTDALKNWIQ